MIDVPIESLVDGDSVISFDRRYVTGPREISTMETNFSGDLVVVNTNDFSTKVTPNHKWFVKLNNSGEDCFIVYMMQQGTRFRIGRTRMFGKREDNHWRLGLQQRVNGERADNGWILRSFSSEQEAKCYEKFISVEYGIPDVGFHSAKGSWSSDSIDVFYNMFNTVEQVSRAKQCLEEHGKDIRFPLIERCVGGRGPLRLTSIETHACNLIPGIMEVPIPGARYDEAFWQPIESLNIQPYNGPVYALDVDQHHKYIQDGLITCNSNLGVDIPRVSVCEDHDPPFKLLADAYFERLTVTYADGTSSSVNGVLAMANRGGAKTFIIAILHFINATFKPGCESLQFGATEGQGQRCYLNIEDWCYEHDKETGRRTEVVRDFILGKPMKSQTQWKTGSKVEVVAGSERAVSGPHPQKAGADEIELMELPVWTASRGMAVSKQASGPLPEFMAKFNGIIPPQDLVTSTRNSRHGLMQELVDEYEEDMKNFNIPQFAFISWCIFETLAEVPHCRMAPKEEREVRLEELDRDPKELCPCHRVEKGRMQDGSPRTLDKVCGGKAFHSRGWKPYVDFVATFKRNTPGTWTLQHECREGKDENNYIQGWDLDTYGLRHYQPRPEYGPIYQGIDWGGTHPYAVLWFQYLNVEVPTYDHEYNPIYLGVGTYVLFKEIYAAEIDTGHLATRVRNIENAYRSKFGHRWKVKARFMDPQGKGDRTLFARKGMPGSWPYKSRDKEGMITTVQNLVIDDRFSVDVDEAPMFCEEIEIWQKDPKNGKEIDKHNHAMAAWRYGISNAEVLQAKKLSTHSNSKRTQRGDSRKIEKPRRMSIYAAEERGNTRTKVRRTGPVTTIGAGRHPTDQFALR